MGSATEFSRRLWRKLKQAVHMRASTKARIQEQAQREADKLAAKMKNKSVDELANTPKHMQGDLMMYTK